MQGLYERLMALADLEGYADEDALAVVGTLVDLSSGKKSIEGTRHALTLANLLAERRLVSQQRSLLLYFVANAWSNLRTLSSPGSGRAWDWEQDEIEDEVRSLRLALNEPGFATLPVERQCQIFTNLGNVLDHIGRFAEAIECWDAALCRLPAFGMALGNRGLGLCAYARALYDSGHASIFVRSAYDDLCSALSLPHHTHAHRYFTKSLRWIERHWGTGLRESKASCEQCSLGTSRPEKDYRKWCLENRLFLNPLNDLGAHSVAAEDVLSMPAVVVPVGEGPYHPGYFSQMKQEFTSARYLLYCGLQRGGPHYADRRTFLMNTLDYPAYSLSVEQTKAAFRMLYSLLDKTAFFLNRYLGLGIRERRVSFRGVWYRSEDRENGLRADMERRRNWPLRGLFWLSKDVYEKRRGFQEAMQPDAQALDEIRNHLEHKYLKLHDDLWGGPDQRETVGPAVTDSLAYSMYRSDFEKKALRLAKMVRAALLYLALAVQREEADRRKHSPGGTVVPMPLGVWDDKWKL